MKEVDVARPVVAELRRMDYEVYQEVMLGSEVADIVAVDDPVLWVIETKVSLSWDLLAQASNRQRFAHKVSVAVPHRKWKHDTKRYVLSMLRREGIGLLFVGQNGDVIQQVEPSFRRNVPWAKRLKESLNEAQKDYVEAGTKGGGYWTPFKATCEEVLVAVRRNPGVSAKELVDSIKHHYQRDSTARSCIIKWARKGIIEGVELRQDGKKLSFHPVEIKGAKPKKVGWS